MFEKKNISILARNLNSGRSYLITAVQIFGAKESFDERLCGIFRRSVLAFGDIYKKTNKFILPTRNQNLIYLYLF